MKNKNYNFELLIIDSNGNSEIQSQNSLLHGLLSTEKLWDSPKEVDNIKEQKTIQDGDISLQINPIDTSSVLYDLYEAAFLLKLSSDNFDRLEKFRYPLIIHLKGRLRFDHIRILTDDISTEISNEIYPLLNEIENTLRRYLAKFFTQKIGLDWWKQAVPDKVIDKTKLRHDNEKVFSNVVATDLTLIDFNDLGEIIYKHKLGFNKPENLVDKILSIDTQEDLSKLKLDLDSNYNRFFKTHFKDFNFDKKWKLLFQIRNKVAHNNHFVKQDLETAQELFKELKEIILNAESKIDDFKFSVVEQEAMIKSSTTKTERLEEDEIEKETTGIKVLGKIDLPKQLENNFSIITEEELLIELERAEENISRKNMTFVGLKSFVTNILAPKGYSYGPTYAQINVLNDKGLIELYDVENEYSNWPVKAVRTIKT
jgi:hypothetical protein